MTNQIDHFAIGCADLDMGALALEQLLGVRIPRGSKHDMMSTHNCVTQSGNESFLELLANDPDAPEPKRARWFSMGDPRTIEKLAARPRALCWVVRTENLDTIVNDSPVPLGEIITFTRGERSWRLTVPQDGHLPADGLIPAFIEWSPGPHPSTFQTDLGVRLKSVNIHHPQPKDFRRTLSALGVDHLADVREGPHSLSFLLDTPNGLVEID